MSYPTEKLGKYIDILSGFAFKSKDFSNTGVPVIKIKNITPPYVSLEDVTYVPNDIATQQKKFQVHYGDILIALTGSHINQMASVVGRIAKVNFFDKALLNQRVGKIYIVDDTSCNLDYVYYFLSQEKVKIELASKAGGAANQANISPTDVKNLQIPFPSKAIQDRIADILLAYDNLIENNQKQIKLLEEAARRLYKEWFVDLRFPGYETTPVVDGVPEGWAREYLVDVVNVQYGYAFDSSLFNSVGNGTPIARIRNILSGTTIISEEIVYLDYPVQHFNNFNYIQWPWIYKPYYREERMNLQSSIFMIWGAHRSPLTEIISPNEFMAAENVTNQECGIICSIDIPANCKRELINQLNLCGINEKFIYPGMDGIGRYIKQKYSSRE